jgi:SAM-dependent methyltransferase
MSTIEERNAAEVHRSASEASKIKHQPINIARYLNPPRMTAFPLEYAFYLLGDVRGKTVVDLGCGSGEELVVLVERGATAIGIDISPELVALAQQRIGDRATVRVGSAYQTGLPDESVDVVFCMSLVHHLDIPMVRDEMRRILKTGGFIVLKEPIRFSRIYARLRCVFPVAQDVSPYEHPLTRNELTLIQEGFQSEKLRFFRLPFVALGRVLPNRNLGLHRASGRLLKSFPGLRRYATSVCLKLTKKAA